MIVNSILLDDFYSEINSDFSAEKPQNFKCLIRLNAEHPIYKGHFPQVPVAPGVCLTQIIKEILVNKFQKELTMTSAENIKFLAMINPRETPELELSFAVKTNENTLEISSNYTHNATTFVKFKGKFSVIQ